jgi:Skp family chaperone for outer membrane proteins
MKRLIACALSLAMTGSAWAGPAGQTTSSGAATTKTKRTTKKSSSTADLSQQLQQMKQAIDAQQQQIQQLRQEMQAKDASYQQAQQQAQQQLQQAQSAASEAQSKASSFESTANEQKASVDRLSTDVTDLKSNMTNAALSAQDEQKRVSAVEGLLGRFRFNGDVRVRGESFFQNYSACKNCLDRNRARIRVRFGFDGKLNEDFIAGVAVATGSLGDPTTTNETLTNFFDRKTFQLDRGYITYNPVGHKWLSLTGGKFPYTWQRTSVTFDPDLNPEGFSEKLSWDLKTSVLKNLSVQGMQLLWSENNSASFLRAADSFAVGGQISGKIEIGRFSSTPSIGVLNWRNTDAIFNASGFAVQATATPVPATGSTTTQVTGLPGEGPGCQNAESTVVDCTFAPNGFTNASFVGPDGKPHFASKFLYGDLILNNTVKTPIAKLPFNLILEAENNLRAAGHPLDAKGKIRTDLGRQSHAYLIDASIGQTKNKNDFQLGYAWVRQEQDSVISSVNESDQRAPTNILQHRVYALWKLRANTVAGYTLWIGHTLNPNLQHAALAPGWTTALGSTEPNLKRMQFDLIYSF